MNLSEVKDKILVECLSIEKQTVWVAELAELFDNNLRFDEIQDLIIEIENDKVASAIINEVQQICGIKASIFTRNFIQDDGYVKRDEYKKLKEQKENDKQSAEYDDLVTNTKLNKWFIKTKYLPYLIALLSLLFSIFTYFDAKSDVIELEKKLKQIEKKLK